MEGTRLGPYRIGAEVGAGGMGKVYSAVLEERGAGLEEGSRVAVKVVHPHLLARPGFFKRFLREADIGRRVRHENVVRTLDMDAAEVDGRTVLFLSMEFVEGRTLRELLADLGHVPEGLLRELARQVAAGLAAIHEQGVVHRDLKPENVLVTHDDQVRIMDLGVARLVEESITLTGEGAFAGSLLYAAPEQFRGGEVGPPADLYALGVLIYELGTGRNPFRRDDTAGVIQAHLEASPPPLDEQSATVSPFLSAVVETLLAKEAGRRFSDAATLALVLEQGEASAWWGEREQERLETHVPFPVIPVRRDTSLHGRGSQLADVREAWKRACDGDGNTLLVVGEAGIGKTRLVDALVQEVGTEDAHVLYGAYMPSGGPGAFSEALLSRFGTRGLEEAVRPYLGEIPSLVPGFASIVRHEPPPTGATSLDGDALHTAMVHLTRALAQERPVLWIVEDLHFAPRESLGIAVALARAVTDHRVLVLLTSRPELPEEFVAHLSRLETFRRLELDRLSPREVMDLLCDAFRSRALAERLGGKIAWKSDGVPFFVFEMIRGLLEGHYLEAQPDGSMLETRVIEEIEVPSAVRDLVAARLKDLSREERVILDVGAVEGFEFDAALLARVLEQKPIHVLQSLAEIERHSGLVRAAGRLTRFDHHQVQDVLYQDQPEALRLEYHAALAEARLARDRVDATDPKAAPRETAVFVARHHLAGSRPEEGLPYLEAALDHLRRSWRHDAVIHLVDEALAIENLIEGRRRVDLLLAKAKGLSFSGRWEAEREVIEEAVDLAETLGDPGVLSRVLALSGSHLVRQARYEEAELVLRRALAAARDLGDVATELSACRDLGVAAVQQSRLEDAETLLDEALRLARRAGDATREASVLGALGSVYRSRGLGALAREHHERHLALARETSDPQAQIVALGNLANSFTYAGDFHEARERYLEALRIAHEIGSRYAEAALTGNLAGMCQTQGAFAEALEHHERAVVLAREVGNRQAEVNVQTNLGRLRLQLGDVQGARAATHAALAIARDVGVRRLEAYALLNLAEIEGLQGDLYAAVEKAGEARSLFEATDNRSGALAALVDEGRYRLRSGDVEGASAVLEDARERADDLESLELSMWARVLLATLPGRAGDAPIERFEQLAGDLVPHRRLRVAHQLWRATGQDRFLAIAHDDLEAMKASAPPGWRRAMVQVIPAHREIEAAWVAAQRPATPSRDTPDQGTSGSSL